MYVIFLFCSRREITDVRHGNNKIFILILHHQQPSKHSIEFEELFVAFMSHQRFTMLFFFFVSAYNDVRPYQICHQNTEYFSYLFLLPPLFYFVFSILYIYLSIFSSDNFHLCELFDFLTKNDPHFLLLILYIEIKILSDESIQFRW
jgi:hypothetical protein